MGKPKIKILDVVNYKWGLEKETYYLILYKNLKYRKYNSGWSEVYDNGKCGLICPNDELDNIWDSQFKGKTIKKVSKIVIE